MKSHRGLIFRAALTAAAVIACLPAGAQASSLLSGYGGPGQGSQALLGAALIGAPSGGGGGTSSGGGSGASVGSLAAPPAQAQHTAGTRGSSHASHGRHAASPAPTAPRTAYVRPAALHFHESGAGSSTLGLSGVDLAYMVALLAGLVLVALLTRGLAVGPRTGKPD